MMRSPTNSLDNFPIELQIYIAEFLANNDIQSAGRLASTSKCFKKILQPMLQPTKERLKIHLSRELNILKDRVPIPFRSGLDLDANPTSRTKLLSMLSIAFLFVIFGALELESIKESIKEMPTWKIVASAVLLAWGVHFQLSDLNGTTNLIHSARQLKSKVNSLNVSYVDMPVQTDPDSNSYFEEAEDEIIMSTNSASHPLKVSSNSLFSTKTEDKMTPKITKPSRP
jgi:hypothetical protein